MYASTHITLWCVSWTAFGRPVVPEESTIRPTCSRSRTGCGVKVMNWARFRSNSSRNSVTCAFGRTVVPSSTVSLTEGNVLSRGCSVAMASGDAKMARGCVSFSTCDSSVAV
uniref:Uncharacterized protein n=1 Tax=Anopheles albimanus TaxID=7167 RepID=A0A182FXI7_ANOAL